MSEEKVVENQFGYEVAVEEMRLLLDDKLKSISAAKAIVEQIFGAASLIIALYGLLGVFNAQPIPECAVVYRWLSIAAIGLYIGLILISVWTLQPVEVQMPVKADWNVLYDSFVAHEEEIEVNKHRLSAYLNAIELNEPLIQKRRCKAQIVTVMFSLIVVLLFGLSFIPKA